MPTTPQQRIATYTSDRNVARNATASLAARALPTTPTQVQTERDLIRQAEAALCRMRRNLDKLAAEAASEASEPASQRLVVVGPNLPASLSHLGTFHVHAEGCADLKRGAIRPYAEQEIRDGGAIEFRTQVEVAEHIYDNGIMTEDETGADYLFDFHFAPCVHLPRA